MSTRLLMIHCPALDPIREARPPRNHPCPIAEDFTWVGHGAMLLATCEATYRRLIIGYTSPRAILFHESCIRPQTAVATLPASHRYQRSDTSDI